MRSPQTAAKNPPAPTISSAPRRKIPAPKFPSQSLFFFFRVFSSNIRGADPLSEKLVLSFPHQHKRQISPAKMFFVAIICLRVFVSSFRLILICFSPFMFYSGPTNQTRENTIRTPVSTDKTPERTPKAQEYPWSIMFKYYYPIYYNIILSIFPLPQQTGSLSKLSSSPSPKIHNRTISSRANWSPRPFQSSWETAPFQIALGRNSAASAVIPFACQLLFRGRSPSA